MIVQNESQYNFKLEMQVSKQDNAPSPPNPITKNLLKFTYTIHFVISICLATFIVFKFPQVVSTSITFVMLLIYGFMGIWVLFISFILVLCKCHEKAVVFSRVIVKFFIFCFPIVGLLSISKEHQLNNKYVHIFILYMGIASLLLIVYQLVSCLCYDEQYPEFLFAQNDLKKANDTVLEKRKQYHDLITSL